MRGFGVGSQRKAAQACTGPPSIMLSQGADAVACPAPLLDLHFV
jgi:hypothetical protein